MDIKDILVSALPDNLKKYSSMIMLCTDSTKGDYTLPCFAIAKEQKKSPVLIASELVNEFDNNCFVDRVESVNGYLNMFLKKEALAKAVLESYEKENIVMYSSKDGQGKTICIDYSSANLAKYLHIGHLSTTILGECIARLFEDRKSTRL